MPLFRLTPIDCTVPEWHASTDCGEVLVCARDEATARKEVGARFRKDRAPRPGGSTRVFNPWREPSHVACTPIPDGRYARDTAAHRGTRQERLTTVREQLEHTLAQMVILQARTERLLARLRHQEENAHDASKGCAASEGLTVLDGGGDVQEG
jgi:hypothetical protein